MKYTLPLLLFLLLPVPAIAAAVLPQTLSELTTVAEEGDAGAQYRLGLIYLHGEGIPADDAWAITWLRRAARQGHAQALAELKQIYRRNGLPLPRDLRAPETDGETVAGTMQPGPQAGGPAPEAHPQATPAAGVVPDLSSPANRLRAMATAMDARKRGDRGMAIAGFQALAEHGEAEAQYQLALLLLDRNLYEQDRQLALSWLNKAASQGLVTAREKLATLQQAEARLPDGEGMEQGGNTASLSKAGEQDGAPVEDDPPPPALTQVPGPVSQKTVVPDTEQTDVPAAVQETPSASTDTPAQAEPNEDGTPMGSGDPVAGDSAATLVGDTQHPGQGGKQGGLSGFLGRIFGSSKQDQVTPPTGPDLSGGPIKEPVESGSEPPARTDRDQVAQTPDFGVMDSETDTPGPGESIVAETEQSPQAESRAETTTDAARQGEATPEPAADPPPADSTTQAVVGQDDSDQADKGGLFGFLGRIFASDDEPPETPPEEASATTAGLPGKLEAISATPADTPQDLAAMPNAPAAKTQPSTTPPHSDIPAGTQAPPPQPVPADTASADPPRLQQAPEDAVAERGETAPATDPIPADPGGSPPLTAEPAPLPDSIEALKALAETGNATAQARLGAIYQAGSVTPRDLRLSLYWYRQAAEQGNPEAEFNLGNMYLLGEGVEVNNHLARDWYQRAAIQGHADAARNLVSMDSSPLYASNDATSESVAEQDPSSEQQDLAPDNTEVEDASPASETPGETAGKTPGDATGPQASASHSDLAAPEVAAVTTEHPDATDDRGGLLGFFGRLLGKDEQPQASIAENTLAGQEPVSLAQDNTPAADKMDVDNGAQTSPENMSSAGLTEQERRSSQPEASVASGNDAVSGQTSDPDPVSATQAEATPGNTGITLAGAWETYRQGNADQALAQFEQLAIQGNAAAQAQLGYMYLVGKGTAMAPEKAFDWLRRGAEQGNADAQYNLAVAYAFGRGVAPDYRKAAHWYRLAAEQGQPQAEFSLGISYAKGEGVEQDQEQALAWYTRAAEHGYADAQYFLGQLYLNGAGVDKDPAAARKWLELAAAQGQDEAGKTLAQLGSDAE